MNSLLCYTDLIKIDSFEDRFEYLCLHGKVGEFTFGSERYLNQAFYRSLEWRRVRDYVITRDSHNGFPCDLAFPEHFIMDRTITIHHMNPITIEDVENGSSIILDPEYLVCTSHRTHNAIHYGDSKLLPKEYKERRPNDTCPWK